MFLTRTAGTAVAPSGSTATAFLKAREVQAPFVEEMDPFAVDTDPFVDIPASDRFVVTTDSEIVSMAVATGVATFLRLEVRITLMSLP